MTAKNTNEGAFRLGDAIRLAPVGLDDWGAVRSLHAHSFARLAATILDPEQIVAFRGLVQSTEYTDALQAEQLQAAWLDGHLIGTAGWTPTDDSGGAARITSLFVDPMFTRMGAGRQLARLAEELATAAGFARFTTRTTANAVPFFLALGYEISSYGVAAFGADCDLPVTYMRRSGDAATADKSAAASAPNLPSVRPEQARAASIQARAMQVGQNWPDRSQGPRANINPRKR